jgi:hypothetical protein
MKTISFKAFQQQVNARKASLGIFDTPDEVEAMRNKGANRTPEKRELLHRAEKRARAAGLKPVIAYF